MKEGIIEKSEGGLAPEALEAIGRYARRPFREEELYTFSLVLCDNEVDRDHERFSIPALERLAELFVGRTGIFDHNLKGSSQTARIYACRVERVPQKTTSAGESYCRLMAEAYMVRSEKNRDLILEIDAGIKKEVSVGCAMSRATCSICGQDRREDPCRHRPGTKYREGGRETVCHTVLSEPSDAYEWSFVAVPAQPAAGVTKGLGSGEGDPAHPRTLLKTLAQKGRLSAQEIQALDREWERLEEEAALGRRWQAELQTEALRLGMLAEPGLSQELLAKTLAPLPPRELEAWVKHYRAKAARRLPLVQTAGEAPSAERAVENGPFKL